MLQRTGRLAIRLLAAIVLVGLLVEIAERRFKRLRKHLLSRGDEFGQEQSLRRSSLLGAARAGSDEHGQQSGHRLLADGPQALATRLALVRAAVNTLDLQYYAWHDDLTGRIMARALLQAAERGVCVRILLDDLRAYPIRRLLRMLAAHPHITIRVYNPSVTRRAYFLNWLFSFRRLNRRMHNKALVADSAAAIVGGRNIGDVYFGFGDNINFLDLDVLTVGPSAQAVKTSFERFWNSEFAMPSTALGAEEQAGEAEVDAIFAHLNDSIWQHLRRRGEKGERQRTVVIPCDHNTVLNKLLPSLIWATATMLDDAPGAEGANRLRRRLWEALGGIRNSLDIVASYFIPSKEDLVHFQKLTARGVTVRVVTNSLSTNDVLPAQISYARHRRSLLAAGVELRELRPDARVRRVLSLLGSAGGAGLHAKVMVADGHLSVIGSHNLDPRSADQNTELVLLIESEAFARELAAAMRQVRLPSESYRIELRQGKIVWVGDSEVLTREPGSTLPIRLLASGMRLFPVEWLL